MTLLLLLVSCAPPVHLQYDFGRAYWESSRIQADLSRPSVANSLYPLSGAEAAGLRENVEKAATDEESADTEGLK
jgi:hypothetical protein